MDKIKVLMLGPGKPNSENSGLGIASFYIAQHLRQLSELTLIQPQPEDQEIREEHRFDLTRFTEEEIVADTIHIKVRHKLSPYFYTSAPVQEASKDVQSEAGKVRTAVNTFTSGVVRESKKLMFDLIYAHDWVTFQAALKIKELTGKPLVLHIHSLDYDRSSGSPGSWIYQIEQEAMKKADAIITVSQYTAQVIKEQYEIATPVHVIYNGYSQITEQARKKKGHYKIFPEKLVLFVGRLTGQKGPGIFMQIAEAVHKKIPGTRFVMAGTGALLKQLIESGAYRNVSGKFHFTGYLRKELLDDLYAAADVYCMPSVSEPFGLSAMEAAGFEIPVVLSKQSGAAEVLEGSFKADYWDVEAFADHIITCLSDRKISAKATATNLDCLESLNWQNTAQSILRVFRDFLK